jgi:hypothetical protein
MSVARASVVLLGLGLAVTLGVWFSQQGRPWAAPVTVVFLWLALPLGWGTFMQEGPAYALALSALLPLLVRGGWSWGLALSAFIATMALSTKLTAAFGLVVPFVWLSQRSRPVAIAWGTAVAGLTLLASWILPGWSWATMLEAHWQPHVAESQAFTFSPVSYAHSWLVVALAAFALGRRWVHGAIAPVIPWTAAALLALLIHLIHRPFFFYYDLHLLTPLTVLGALGFMDILGLSRKKGPLLPSERLGVIAVVLAACIGWSWQRITQIATHRRLRSPVIASSPIVRDLNNLRSAGAHAFAISPIWTFSAKILQTPPELTVLSLKRKWSGTMPDERVVALIESNDVAAIVVSPRIQRIPVWSDLLSRFVATAQDGDDALYVRKDLNPQPLDLSEKNTAILRRLLTERETALQPRLKR